MQLHFGVDAPLLHESRLTGSVAKRFQKAGRRARAGATVEFTHSKCGSGGWPGPHFFFWLLALAFGLLANSPRKIQPSSDFVIELRF
jgi:hypothetical protein